jgi:uncharacterized protein (UPF0276 family)
MTVLPAGAGLAFHPRLASVLLARPPAFVEFIAENLQTSTLSRQARAFAEVVATGVHGVGLGLGAAAGIDDDRARLLFATARAVGARVVSEHVAFVRAGGTEIGHLTPLPLTRVTVDVVARNVARAQRHNTSRLPFLLENPWSPLPPGFLRDEMEEPEFLHAVVDATGCGLLLDASNLWANAKNRGVSVRAWLERLPLHAVREIHVGGSAVDAGFVVDTHADPVDVDVFAFVAAVLARTGPVPVCLERDRNVDVDAVCAEADALAALIAAAPSLSSLSSSLSPSSQLAQAPSMDAEHGSIPALAAEQAALAARLVAPDERDPALRIARAVLARKGPSQSSSSSSLLSSSLLSSSWWSGIRARVAARARWRSV